MISNSTNYLSTLHRQIDEHFNISEVRTLCLRLGVDDENIPGDHRSAFVRNLIVSLARQNRLPDLIDEVRRERPSVDWQDVPADFALPATLAQESIQQVTNYRVYSGDVVHGSVDKSSTTFNMAGQTVRGSQVNVTGDANIGHIGNSIQMGGGDYVIGRDAQAYGKQGVGEAQLTELFAPLLSLVAQQNPTAVSQVKALKEEVGKGGDADDEKMADLIAAIAEAAPAAVAGLVNLFANSTAAKAVGGATQYVLKRISR